ncbi:transposable element Tc3 transposase [Trichonephila clavipes]|nr:transposable element Tc3 transposase [Trichonephila clavipes]
MVDFNKRILFSNEAHFWFNGYVNKQNCRIWSEANPQVYIETPLHPEKLTVWRALLAGGIIGPYFFKNDEGHNVTVNGDRYRAMITNFFIPELNNHDVQQLWFQEDGATCHTARATIYLLKDTFGDRLISHIGPLNWPPRSCDLTPLDYFLWGYVKSLVYVDKPQTLDKCWKKSSKIGRPDWTTSEPAVAVLCQTSYLKWPEPDEIGNGIEEVVDISRNINLEVHSDDVQKLLDSHKQELAINKLIEINELEQEIEPIFRLS